MKNLMLSLLSAGLIIGIMLTGGCVSNEASTQIIEDITAQEAFSRIQDNTNNPDFVILDVRTPEEFNEGHVENAVNLNFNSDTFRDGLDQLDRDKTYLIYCRSGNRSGRALEVMIALDFREVYDMSGGIIEWEAEGLPTTTIP